MYEVKYNIHVHIILFFLNFKLFWIKFKDIFHFFKGIKILALLIANKGIILLNVVDFCISYYNVCIIIIIIGQIASKNY